MVRVLIDDFDERLLVSSVDQHFASMPATFWQTGYERSGKKAVLPLGSISARTVET